METWMSMAIPYDMLQWGVLDTQATSIHMEITD